MITLQLDDVYEEAVAGLSPKSKSVERATKRALRKTVRGLQRSVLRIMSAQSGVAQKNIKKYQRVEIKLAGMNGILWVGLNPLPLHLSGRVSWSQKSAGARVKGQTFAGAFYRKVYSGTEKVWIRSIRNQRQGYATYHARRPYRAFSGEVNRGRFPIELLGVPMEDSQSPIEQTIQNWAPAFFKKRLLEELNFAINHEQS